MDACALNPNFPNFCSPITGSPHELHVRARVHVRQAPSREAIPWGRMNCTSVHGFMRGRLHPVKQSRGAEKAMCGGRDANVLGPRMQCSGAEKAMCWGREEMSGAAEKCLGAAKKCPGAAKKCSGVEKAMCWGHEEMFRGCEEMFWNLGSRRK